MASIGPDTIIASVSFLTLLILMGSGVYWFGKLSGRVDQLEGRVGQLENRVDQLANEMRAVRSELLDAMREQRSELLEEMNKQRNELLEEMRRGNQQLLLALVNHTHDGDGAPVFRIPVSPE